jgi:type III secretion protein HrpB1
MNPFPSETDSDALSITKLIFAYARAGHLHEAQMMLDHLHAAHPATRDMPAVQVLLALRRRQPLDAWQVVNGLPDEQCPELKALCLKILNDPAWQGYAVAHEDSSDLHVRRMMKRLLGKADEHDC